MLDALVDGERDPAVLAQMARRALRAKIAQLTEALQGRFTDHHAFMVRMHLGLIDQHSAAIDDLTDRIETVIKPFRVFRDLICTIPGIGPLTADVVIAETGADMSRFASAGHLASWAGTTPGMNESAGKVKSSHVRPGNPYLKGALGTTAMNLSRMPGTYLGVRYRRLSVRSGPMRANVATQRAILTAIWHMGTTGALYIDPGPDYFTRLNPSKAKARAVHQLEAVGYAVTLHPNDKTGESQPRE
jgi:transposase